MSIADALKPPTPGKYKPMPAPGAGYEPMAPPPAGTQPGPNPFIRCPLPPIKIPSADSLRQFYRDGVGKQRIFPI